MKIRTDVSKRWVRMTQGVRDFFPIDAYISLMMPKKVVVISAYDFNVLVDEYSLYIYTC